MEKVILVGLNYKLDIDIETSLKELAALAKACNLDVIGSITQNLERPNAKFYVGKGKVSEIKNACELHEAKVVVFNDELSPSHIRNLEEELECKVIDRTILILDIFASRAKSREAMLQVEIAQLKYMLPRLIGMSKSLNRQQGGVGSKGPGEKKLEMDRRRIESQVSKLNKELKEVVRNREVSRKRRKEGKVVALVGYTNAGKSSFMNALLEENPDKKVLEKDMLFATLETSTRKVLTANNQSFLLTDTVGFVHKLPHHLVNAFKSTLEEVCEADLLIHMVDVANENYAHQVKVTNEVLGSIGAGDIEMIYALNKVDLCDDQVYNIDGISISCKTNYGIEELIDKVESKLWKLNEYNLLIPFDKMSAYNSLKQETNVISEEYVEEGCLIKVILNEKQLGIYNRYQQKEKAE